MSQGVNWDTITSIFKTLSHSPLAMYILVLIQNLRPCLDQAAGIHETSHSQNIVIFQVFDIISKLGEGSYGSVYKAVHKESKQVST